MVKGLPSQNIFLLTCCFDKERSHPVCQKGRPNEMPTWYKGGLAVTFHFLWWMWTDHGEAPLAAAVRAFLLATI